MTIFQSINPATDEIIAEYAAADAREIEEMLAKAEIGFQQWSQLSIDDRGAVLRNFSKHVRENIDALAQLAALEMGKPLAQGRAEAEKCAFLCEYFADHAEEMLAPEQRGIDQARVMLRKDPTGCIFSITPWNFPLWQILRAAVPALAAGNVVLNKPAPIIIGCAKKIIALFEDAGAPEGVLQTIDVTNNDAAKIIADPRIAGVALTGSERAGAAVAAAAGANLKKVVLELGGSDPFIVLADADIAAAAKTGVKSRFNNAGQVCIAAKRFIVEAPVFEKFQDAFLAETDALVMGDPTHQGTTLGPMARKDLRDQLEDQVNATIESGAKVLRSGGAQNGPGNFFAPCVMSDVKRDAVAIRDETFGPAAVLISVADENEAVALANGTKYGLSANLWTSDLERAKRMAAKIEAGGVFINSMTASDPRLPFGGIKRSGFGRELGTEGMMEFVNLKTVYAA